MRLYKMEITVQPKVTMNGAGALVPAVNDESWHLFCFEKWGKVVDYFNPSEDRFYKSRSSAADKVGIVEYYGGEAVVLEAEVGEFVPVAEANARRKKTRDAARVAKLQAQIDAIEAAK